MCQIEGSVFPRRLAAFVQTLPSWPQCLDYPCNGLGLAIVKAIVTLHQGTIHVRSEETQGTNITVTLPVLSTYSHGPFPEGAKLHQLQGNNSKFMYQQARSSQNF